MRIDDLLEALEDSMEEGISVPLSGGKRMVDIEHLQELIQDIRINLPMEIQQAKAIARDKNKIIANAKKEAETIVKRAEDRARMLVAQEAVVAAAQERANEIATQAQMHSREMRTKVSEYCDDMLQRTEEQLQRSSAEVKTLRASLHKQPKKAGTARVTPRPQNQQLP